MEYQKNIEQKVEKKSLVGKKFEFENYGLVTVVEDKENHIIVVKNNNEKMAIYKPLNFKI